MTQQADKQISVKLCKQIVFALILFSVGRSRAQDFFSKPLPAPNQPDALSEVATSSAFHGDSIYVATEATLADGRKTIRLYKIDADEQVVWVVDSNFSGSVHALSTAADPETGSVSAFVGKARISHNCSCSGQAPSLLLDCRKNFVFLPSIRAAL